MTADFDANPQPEAVHSVNPSAPSWQPGSSVYHVNPPGEVSIVSQAASVQRTPTQKETPLIRGPTMAFRPVGLPRCSQTAPVGVQADSHAKQRAPGAEIPGEVREPPHERVQQAAPASANGAF